MIPSFPVYLFDVDGTLLDSAADICGAVRESLARAGCEDLEESLLRSYIGRHLFDLYQDLMPGISAGRMDEILQDYRKIYLGRGHGQTRVYAGVEEALAVLGGRKSTATTKSTPTTRAILEQFGLARFFDHFQGTDGFPAKPEPNVILKSLEAFQAQPQDCLLVGDSAADMEAGRRAGLSVCAVRYGYGDVAELARFEPDYWVDDLRELVR